MNERVIYFAKLTGMSIFSFIKINMLGATSTAIFALVGFILLNKNIDPGPSVHGSPIPYLMQIFLSKPFTSSLFYLVFVASPFLFFFLGNKYILSKVIHKVLRDKSENYLEPILDRVLIKIKEIKDNLIGNGENYKNIKIKLTNQLKNENENKWLKRTISYGLKKAKLDDVDFKDENLSHVDVIKKKIIQTLMDVSLPSRRAIWILILIQWIVVLLIWALLK